MVLRPMAIIFTFDRIAPGRTAGRSQEVGIITAAEPFIGGDDDQRDYLRFLPSLARA